MPPEGAKSDSSLLKWRQSEKLPAMAAKAVFCWAKPETPISVFPALHHIAADQATPPAVAS
jgi:hypothetical protein